MRPSLGSLGVIFDVGQASRANQSKEWFLSVIWSHLELILALYMLKIWVWKILQLLKKFTVTPEKHPKVILTNRYGCQTNFGSKIGDFEPLGVNIDPIYAQNLILKNFTVTQKFTVTQLLKKIYSYSKNLQLLQISTQKLL